MVDKAFLKTFVELETVETQKKRQEGLQGRKKLGEYKGMLFKFDKAERQSIWMKDTHIPLDIVFLSEQGKVLNIEQGEPESTKKMFSDSENCKYVLELNKGKAADFNISLDDNLSFLLPTGL